MGMCSSKSVSPSEQVDHVWHIHLAHNDNYKTSIEWLYGKCKKYNHVPTRGGND